MFSFAGADSAAPENITLVVSFRGSPSTERIPFSRRMYRYSEVLCAQAEECEDGDEVFLPHVVDREVFGRLCVFLREWDELPNKFAVWVDTGGDCMKFGDEEAILKSLPPTIARVVLDPEDRLLSPFDEKEDLPALLATMRYRASQRAFDDRRQRIIAARKAYMDAGGRVCERPINCSMLDEVTISAVSYTPRPVTVLTQLMIHADFLGITPLMSLLAHVFAVGIRGYKLSEMDTHAILGERGAAPEPQQPPAHVEAFTPDAPEPIGVVDDAPAPIGLAPGPMLGLAPALAMPPVLLAPMNPMDFVGEAPAP